MGKNNAKIIDIQTLMAAGIDPKTGLPQKMVDQKIMSPLKESIKRLIRIQDEQNAINRFTWTGLPDGITGQMLERMLYYKGQICFFYFKEMDQFYIMPYALSGGIDYYGRFIKVHPVPFSGGTTDEEKAHFQRQSAILSTKILKPDYEPMLPEELMEESEEDYFNACVLLKDYSEQYSQTIIPRQALNDSVIDVEAECIPYMRTALIRATGVRGIRVGADDEQSNVQAANLSIEAAALNGQVNIPIIGALAFQELNDGVVGKADEFMMALQSLENFRLSTYGLDNGGLFQKRERKLVAEQEMNAASGGINLIMQDGLALRQRFATIINARWGLGVWCMPSETVSGTDYNLDGDLSDMEEPMETEEVTIDEQQ